MTADKNGYFNVGYTEDTLAEGEEIQFTGMLDIWPYLLGGLLSGVIAGGAVSVFIISVKEDMKLENFLFIVTIGVTILSYSPKIGQ